MIVFKTSFRIFMIFSFFFYLICLTYLLFFGHGRGLVSNMYSIEHYKMFYQISTNFIPFKTITLYMTDGGRYLNPGIAFENLVGNVVAFAPFGFFMPLLFKKFKSWGSFITFAFAAPVLAEVIQFVTFLGRTDIDDVILNSFGAILIFTIIKTPLVSNLIYKIVDQ